MTGIYLDHAASTPLLPEVWEAMRPWALQGGNAASSHAFGRRVRKALEDARSRTARCLDADPDEVLFTSGATEANNLALFGLAGEPPGSVASCSLEHPCVIEPVQRLLARGFTSWPLSVPASGVAGPFPESWPTDLRLATLMLVNHETGAIQPIEELRRALPPKTPLHCDAAAALGKIPVSFRRLGVTSLTGSAHKFHGPTGIGILLVKRAARLNPLLFGGHQQQGKRPGTESVALAVGLATALEAASQTLDRQWEHVHRLRSMFLDGLKVVDVVVNSPEASVPHIVNVSFPGVQADALLMALDLAGVACSTGSACSSGSLLPSPVLRAMNVSPARLGSAMRFSFSALTTAAETAEAVRRIVNSVRRLGQLSQTSDE